MSVDPLVEITMSPYTYTWNDPVNYTDPSGMIGERVGNSGGPNPDSFWHIITWSKAHRNAQRYANKMQFGNNSVNMYKHGDGDYSVDTSFGNGLHNKATFSSEGEVYNKDYGIYVGDIQGQSEGSSIITNYPAPNPWDASFKSPNSYHGQSQYEFVMVDANPLMPAIAGVVCPGCGALAGAAVAANDVSEGNYVGAAVGAALLITPIKRELWTSTKKLGNIENAFEHWKNIKVNFLIF